MRRWTLLLAGAALWLFLAAIPALADGGPHVAATNSGASSLTADSCAGCHRAHTAIGPMLLNAPSDEALCLTCHGASVTGATTDVMTGMQYVPAVDDPATAANEAGTRTDTQLGALRNGGFDQARIGVPARYRYGTGMTNFYGKVSVGAAADVTSSHIPALGGLTQPGIAWGNGANGTGIGPAVSLSCGSCHNPHGNGQYRILNPLPASPASANAWVKNIVDVGVATYTGTTNLPPAGLSIFRTADTHFLLIGDNVTVAGNSEASANVTGVVNWVSTSGSSSNQFTITGITVAAPGTGGTVIRNGGVKVWDAPNATNATRNYTVIQTAGSVAYTLLASEVPAAGDATTGDYWHRQVPWNGGGALNGTVPNADAPNGNPSQTANAPAFAEQMTVWCSSCHTRYAARRQPTTNPANGTIDNSFRTARPLEGAYMYQHPTNGTTAACTTCHVSHGSNAAMDGAASSAFTYPNTTASASSRLLKVGNRGTCQLCHDPTNTTVAGAQYPDRPSPVLRRQPVGPGGPRHGRPPGPPRCRNATPAETEKGGEDSVRRWTLLLAGAALWLFLAAIPALADGGPHVAATNSGASSLTADNCAGCHRAHTAIGPMLLNGPVRRGPLPDVPRRGRSRAPPRTS